MNRVLLALVWCWVFCDAACTGTAFGLFNNSSKTAPNKETQNVSGVEELSVESVDNSGDGDFDAEMDPSSESLSESPSQPPSAPPSEFPSQPPSEIQSVYPEWSWDHVHSYVAIRRGDKYDDAQIRELANQDIVMLEKMNGHETYGSIEEGTLQAARRIKAVNPKVKILFYLNSMVHYGGYSANEHFKEDWAMKNRTNAPLKWRKKYLSYDHSNLQFREWWIGRALDMLAHDEIDGVFIDGIVKAVMRWIPVRNHGKAYLTTAMELKERLPAGKILIGNALRANGRHAEDGHFSHLEYLDGSYLEGWAHTNNLAPTLDLMSKALKQDKIIMLNTGPNNLDTRKYNRIQSLNARYDYVDTPYHIDFPLGFFLLVVEPHAYLSYHVGVDARPRRKTVFDNTRFEAITRELGEPVDDYVKEGKYVYTREFEHLKVWVDLEARKGVLTVKDDTDGKL